MDRNWQPGDRAIVDCSGSKHHGEETTIVAVGVKGESLGYFYKGCRVDIRCPSTGGLCVFENHELRPIYDGNETVSWESMKDIFEPSPVVTV